MAAKAKAADAEGEAPKKSKKKMMIIVAVLVLGAGGYYFMGMKKTPAKAVEPKPGLVVAMDANTVNLADGHFLKIKLGLQTTTTAKKDLDTSEAADIMINEFTNRPMQSMTTTAQRNSIKDDLVKKLKVAYPKEIMDVYFTEFVMQ